MDEEWPQTAKNALARLWGMHNESSNARIAERIASTKLLKELSDEKKKIEKKYNDMVDDVNKLIKDTTKTCMEANCSRIQSEEEHDKMTQQMAITIELLQTQVRELKLMQKSEADVMKAKEQQWDNEKKELKEEKRKLEYQLFDVFKDNNARREKLDMIQAICNE